MIVDRDSAAGVMLQKVNKAKTLIRLLMIEDTAIVLPKSAQVLARVLSGRTCLRLKTVVEVSTVVRACISNQSGLRWTHVKPSRS